MNTVQYYRLATDENLASDNRTEKFYYSHIHCRSFPEKVAAPTGQSDIPPTNNNKCCPHNERITTMEGALLKEIKVRLAVFMLDTLKLSKTLKPSRDDFNV